MVDDGFSMWPIQLGLVPWFMANVQTVRCCWCQSICGNILRILELSTGLLERGVWVGQSTLPKTCFSQEWRFHTNAELPRSGCIALVKSILALSGAAKPSLKQSHAQSPAWRDGGVGGHSARRLKDKEEKGALVAKQYKKQLALGLQGAVEGVANRSCQKRGWEGRNCVVYNSMLSTSHVAHSPNQGNTTRLFWSQ